MVVPCTYIVMSLSHVPKIPLADKLIAWLYRSGRPGLAATLLWQTKGCNLSSLIQWPDASGMTWMLNPHVAIDRALLLTGRHDPEIFDILSAEIRPHDVVWDIGANIGCLSLPLVRMHKTVRLVAFEPSPAAAHQFTLNAELNGLKAELVTTPLADCLRAECLHIKLSRNSGQNSLRPWEEVSYDFKIHLLCESAASLMEKSNLPEPNIVKLDVEQFEEEVLRGMEPILRGSKLRLLIFECMRNNSPQRFQAISDLLSECGFRIDEIPPEPGKPVENFVARRTGLA